MEEHVFDQVADAELHFLEEKLLAVDPDDLEVDLASGVLTLTFADDQKVIVNSHRAAGQIWLAAFRQAWHFSPHQENGHTVWRTASEELRSTLQRLVGTKLGRPFQW